MRLKIFCNRYYGDICEREVNPFCEGIEKNGGKIINIKTEYIDDYYRVYVVYKKG